MTTSRPVDRDDAQQEAPTDLDRRRLFLEGRGQYIDDVRLATQPLALHVVRSDVAHGILRAIETQEARVLAGVHAVLTAADMDEVPSIPIRKANRPGMEDRLQRVLAVDRVRYVGEPLAVVVADDRATAEDAGDLIWADIEPLGAVVRADQEGPSLWQAPVDNVFCTIHARVGDLDEMLSSAHCTVRETFHIGRSTGLPIETRGLLASWEDGVVNLWGPTKFLHFTRRVLANQLGIPADHVVCHRVDVGGMFGPRGEFYPEDFLVPWASRVVGAPVKWVEDRREHLMTVNHCREQRHEVVVAASRDGELLAFTDRVLVDMGAYTRPIGARIPELVVETLPGPYNWKAFDVNCEGRATNKTPVGTARGPGALEANFVRERMVDKVAATLGIDPIELRRRNLIRRQQLPFVRDFGGAIEHMTYDSGDYRSLFDATLKDGGYGRLETDAHERRSRGECVGVGVAVFLEPSGIGVEETVSVSLDAGGVFRVATSAAEVGQGLDRTIVRVASSSLGCAAGRVQVDSGSTSAHEGGMGTFGSRTTVFVGSAVNDACQRLLVEAKTRASEMLAVPLGDLSVVEAGVCGTETETLAPWEKLAPIEVVGRYASPGPTFGFGCHIAVVSVDSEIGMARAESAVIGYDCGRAIDRSAVEGQLVGATVQGIGYSLHEELIFDDKGQPLSATFMDYLVPTSMEAPAVNAFVYEDEPAPGNPLGVKGAGEAGVAGIGGAVANAIASALGDPAAGPTRLPFTPRALWELTQRGRAFGREETGATS